MGGLADLLTLWSHALAALLFALLAVWAWRAHGRRPLAIAFALTALWALAVAGIGNRDGVTSSFEALCNLGWLHFVWRLLPRGQGGTLRRAALLSHATVAAVLVVSALVTLVGAGLAQPDAAGALADAAIILRLLALVGGLVLVQNAYARAAAAPIRAAALSIAAIWLVDVNLLTLAWATGEWPTTMEVVRGGVLVTVAAVFAANAGRVADRPVQLSRTAAVQSLSMLAVLSYLAIFAGVTEAIEALGGRHARVLQTAFVFGSTATALAVLSTPALRAWLRVKVAKHLFRHRYDYRTEWMRFTGVLSRGEADAPLGERVTRAVAELLDCPAGALLACDAGALTLAATWNWDDAPLPPSIDDRALCRHLAETGRVIELDAVRAGSADGDRPAVPPILLAIPDAWAIVPLPQPGGLAGAILLARPPIARTLDWEDFDLLKVAGRQAAASLAEWQAQTRLAEAERFDEFNRRFAFILHDIKNLVSQLSLVARNAERHADNPAFRADMAITLNEATARMNDLVARLSPAGAVPAVTSRAVVPIEIAERIAASHRLSHPVTVKGDAAAIALGDAAGIEQILRHLIQNAIDASAPGVPVEVAVIARADRIAVEVTDHGCGMSPAFIRERLFRPFTSTKAAGFGIGAYEARSLTLAMGGTLDVHSREGAGTRFTLTLPAAAATAPMEHAA